MNWRYPLLTRTTPGVVARGEWWRRTVAVLFMASTTLLVPTQACAEQGPAVGMVIQVTVEHGTIDVLPEGSTLNKPARPLLALRAGDTIRATANASVLVSA